LNDWQESTVGSVCQLIDGDRGPQYPKRSDYLTDGHCLFLSTKNVRPNGFDFSECQYLSEGKHKTLRNGTLLRGDVVITTRGTIGNVAYYGNEVVPNLVRINSGMLIMRPNSQIRGEYLSWFVRSPLFTAEVGRQQTGSAQPQLPVGILKKFPVRFPGVAQQEALIRRIKAAVVWIDGLASEASSARKLINHLDQAILAKAFRGELVPQDPNDEPASVLLERIGAERVIKSSTERPTVKGKQRVRS
jgi:type I restriction enzyme S subunit